MSTSTFSNTLYVNQNNCTNHKHFGEDLSGHNIHHDEPVIFSDFVGKTALWTVVSDKRKLFLLEHQIASLQRIWTSVQSLKQMDL